MDQPQSVLTGALVLGGGMIMLFAILRLNELIALLTSKPQQARWRTLRAISCVFLGGYGLTLFTIVADKQDWLRWLTGVVFLLGSAFVYAVAHNGLRIVSEMQKEMAALADANVLAAELMVQLEETGEELRAAKDKAESAERTKGRFLANISHELRTPMNGILGYAQILSADEDTMRIARARDGIEVIQRSGTHLLRLLNDLLDLTKLEAQKMTLSPTDFSLRPLLAEVEEVTRPRAMEKAIRLELESSAELPEFVRGDATRLQQVLLNLVGNAVRFTDEGGVRLKVDLAGEGKLRFEVSDTGIGMSQEDLRAVWAPFQQASTPSRPQEGTGLGLAISRDLIQLMGGELTATSTPGAGSKFSFELSLPRAESGNTTARLVARPIRGYVGARKRVLVVDDVEHNRKLLGDFLSGLGFDVAIAVDGQDALDKAKAFSPDLVLMDLVMPVLGGTESVSVMRQTEALEGVKIVGVSASTNPLSETDLTQLGFDAFLLKPIDFPQLLATIKAALGIEWVTAPAERADSMTSLPMVAPADETLVAISALASDGDFSELEALLTKVESDGPQHRAFTRKIRTLAKEFDEAGISRFIDATRVAQ